MSGGKMKEVANTRKLHEDYVNDVFDVNIDLKDLDNRKDIDYVLANKMIGSYLMAMLFNIQSFAVNLKDAYIFKSWIEWYLKEIDKGKDLNIEVLEDLGVSFNKILLEDFKLSMDPILRRLKDVYKDLFLPYSLHLNDRAYEVLEAIDEGLLTLEDLEEIFDNRLDISSTIMGKLKNAKRVEEEILRDISEYEKYYEITFEDFFKDVKKVNKILHEEKTSMLIQVVIYKENNGQLKRQRFNGSIKESDRISNYVISYMLIDNMRLNGEGRVRKKFTIYNYNDYLNFKREMKSIENLMLGGR